MTPFEQLNAKLDGVLELLEGRPPAPPAASTPDFQFGTGRLGGQGHKLDPIDMPATAEERAAIAARRKAAARDQLHAAIARAEAGGA